MPPDRAPDLLEKSRHELKLPTPNLQLPNIPVPDPWELGIGRWKLLVNMAFGRKPRRGRRQLHVVRPTNHHALARLHSALDTHEIAVA